MTYLDVLGYVAATSVTVLLVGLIVAFLIMLVVTLLDL